MDDRELVKVVERRLQTMRNECQAAEAEVLDDAWLWWMLHRPANCTLMEFMAKPEVNQVCNPAGKALANSISRWVREVYEDSIS